MNQDSTTNLLIRARAAYRYVVEDPEGSRRQIEDLVTEARQAGEPEALCLALRAYGWSERYRLAHRSAKATLDEAVRLARRHRLHETLGQLLITRGAVNLELGRTQAAERDYKQAEHLVPEWAQSELIQQRATLLANAGRLVEAGQLYEHVLQDPHVSPEVRFHSGNNLAMTLAWRGRFDEALAAIGPAISVARTIGPNLVARGSETRAWITVQAGLVTEGIRQFDEAVHAYESANLQPGELYAEYTDALTDLRLLPEARRAAQQAVDNLAPQGAGLMAAEATLRVAQLALLSGDFGPAIDAARSATEQFQGQRRSSWAARAALIAVQARLALGDAQSTDYASAIRSATSLARAGMRSHAVDAYLTAGRVAKALGKAIPAVRCWTRAYDLSAGLPFLIRLKGMVAGALAAEQRGQPDRVRSMTEAAIEDLAKHRAALPSTELRSLASGHGEELGRLGLAARVEKQPASRVLNWMELTRAAALSIVEDPHTEDIEDEIGELRAIYAELVAARQETGTEPPELRHRQTRVEQRIRAATWRKSVSGAHATAALSTPKLRQALRGRTLVEFDLLGDSLVAAVLEPRRTRIVHLGELDTVQQDVESLLFNLRFLSARAESPAASGMHQTARILLDRLRTALLDPLSLAPGTELVVVPVSKLHALPWAALHDGPVAVSASGSMWARSSATKSAAGLVVLVAGPELPGAEQEVATLAELHADPILLRSGHGTMAAVAEAFDDATLAHIACHCFIRGDNPTFSSLLLSDGYLTVHELDLRSDVPHRVILAACESGQDVSYEGNELLGFVSTLMARGAAGVVASAVLVPDEDLLPLMTALHKRIIDGQTLTQALHGARATLDPSDPKQFVAWCAFNAYGAA